MKMNLYYFSIKFSLAIFLFSAYFRSVLIRIKMSGIPEEMVKVLENVDSAVTNLENALDKFLESKPQYEQMSTLDKAREDLATLFAINSCYWAHQRFKGKDPNDDAQLAAELERNKKYNAQLKQFEELDKRPKYNPKTVGRFVKNALFDIHGTGNGDASSSQVPKWIEPDSNGAIKSGEANHSKGNGHMDMDQSNGADGFAPVISKRKRKHNNNHH